MAFQPHMLEFTVGMVLAMALLVVTTWVVASPMSPISHPQLLLLY
jgi:hypothetical protein